MRKPIYDIDRDVLEVVRQTSGFLRDELKKSTPNLELVASWADEIGRVARLSKQTRFVQRQAAAIRVDRAAGVKES